MTLANDTVPIGAIAAAPTPQVSPDPVNRQTNPLTGRDERFDQELGAIGRHIGGGSEKAGNIAYVVVLASIVILVGLIISLCFVTNTDAQKALSGLTTGFLSLVTGALGYLFGSGRKG